MAPPQNKANSVVCATPRKRVIEPFWSENGYRLYPPVKAEEMHTSLTKACSRGGWPFRPVCGCQAIFLRTNKWLNSVRKPTNSSALCAELLGTSKAPKHVVHFISLSSGYARNPSMVATVHWLPKECWKLAAPWNKTNFEFSRPLRCNL